MTSNEFCSEEDEAEAALSSMVTSLECEVLIIIFMIITMLIMIKRSVPMINEMDRTIAVCKTGIIHIWQFV